MKIDLDKLKFPKNLSESGMKDVENTSKLAPKQLNMINKKFYVHLRFFIYLNLLGSWAVGAFLPPNLDYLTPNSSFTEFQQKLYFIISNKR
jgi:hypothetical protein